MTKYDLPGRTVVITGSTGGLGSALARALHARGANLALLDIDQNATQAQASELGGDRRARGFAGDVRDLDNLTTVMNQTADHFGRIDIVIANAGIGTIAPLPVLDPEAWDRVIDINLNGVWRTFRAAYPHINTTSGYLLAISSMAAFVHNPLMASYAATKAGVWAMCDSIRLELRHTGIDVGSAHPTWFKTPMTDTAFADPAGAALSRGSTSGIWATVPIDTVVKDITTGIERRARTIRTPRSLRYLSALPGAMQRFTERTGFPHNAIEKASALATPTGSTPPTNQSTDITRRTHTRTTKASAASSPTPTLPPTSRPPQP